MGTSGRGTRLNLADLNKSLGVKPPAAAAVQPPAASEEQPAMSAATGSDGSYLTSVAVERLAPNPRNSRESLEDLEDLSTIVDVQLQPATVVTRDSWLQLYPDDADAIDGAEYVVVNGCRRLAAARHFGRPDLDIVVHDSVAKDDQSVISAMLIENIARENLNPMEEAKGVQMLLNAAPTAAAVARMLGKSESWVSKRRKLLLLDPELQEELRTGRMLIEEGWKLGRFPSGEQVAAWLAEQEAKENPSPEPESEPESAGTPDADEESGSEAPDPAEKIVRALRGAKADVETVVAALEEFFDPAELVQVKAMIGTGK